ncbi:hypothetical protein AD006_30175 (plasmid) [Pseudonocardia sp. EC080610-09]|nr:hypothetical protein AD006_30175 [Pseudonocardia sp. EC080610-09]ALL85543.1 hypothetical protein AD017_31075 [Pseudonocardia sp. EC080619-01]
MTAAFVVGPDADVSTAVLILVLAFAISIVLREVPAVLRELPAVIRARQSGSVPPPPPVHADRLLPPTTSSEPHPARPRRSGVGRSPSRTAPSKNPA